MFCMFYNCKLLSTLPDISKWNSHKVIDMSKMFKDCESLSSLLDISKWNSQKYTDMSSMFTGTKIQNIPKKFGY